jgi:hypothetical protein
MLKFFKNLTSLFSDLSYYAKMEQYIKDKKPQSHADLERIIRDYYSCRGL